MRDEVQYQSKERKHSQDYVSPTETNTEVWHTTLLYKEENFALALRFRENIVH